MPLHRMYGTVCCAHWSVGIVRRPLLTDLKSVEFESIRYGRVSRRRDSVAVYQWVAPPAVTGGWDGADAAGQAEGKQAI